MSCSTALAIHESPNRDVLGHDVKILVDFMEQISEKYLCLEELHAASFLSANRKLIEAYFQAYAKPFN